MDVLLLPRPLHPAQERPARRHSAAGQLRSLGGRYGGDKTAGPALAATPWVTSHVTHCRHSAASVLGPMHAEVDAVRSCCLHLITCKHIVCKPNVFVCSQLEDALEGALSSSPFLAKWCMPLVLEKLSSTHRQASRQHCCFSYNLLQ